LTDPDEELATISRVVPGLIQQLTQRLTLHGLGEIEVRRGDLRVRVVAPPTSGAATAGAKPTAVSTPSHAAQGQAGQAGRGHPPHPAGADPGGVMSPAVGYFSYADGLGPGLTVEKGDALGYVDVLGVRHDVRAPRSGVVRNLVTETGEAVEYGQLLIELEAVGS
jgi:acetyl-CoA carboxylase biotin carboxyl carrier protein